MTSLFELTNRWDRPRRCRYIDTFNNERNSTWIPWNVYEPVGSGSAVNPDTVDGGMKFTTADSGSNDNIVFDWDSGDTGGASSGIKPFNPNGCVQLSTVRLGQTTQSRVRVAMGGTTANVGQNLAYADLASDGGGLGGNSGKINLRYNKNTSSLGATGTDVTLSTNWVDLKLEFKTTTIELGINGILKATVTGNNPFSGIDRTATNAGMMPSVYVLDLGYGASVGEIRYMECYNT